MLALVGMACIIGTVLYCKPLDYAANAILFQPQNISRAAIHKYVNTNNMIRERITDSNNNIIDAALVNTLKQPSYSDKICVYFHGNAGWNGNSVCSYHANLLSQYGSVFVFDYRGYGLSDCSSITPDSVVSDGITVWDFLTNTKHVKPENIIFMGHSMGCAVATSVISDLGIDVGRVILEAPFISLQEMAQHTTCSASQLLISDDLNNMTNLAKIKSPVCIVHAKHDTIVPYIHGKRLANKHNTTFIKSINGDHNNCIYDRDMLHALNTFMS